MTDKRVTDSIEGLQPVLKDHRPCWMVTDNVGWSQTVLKGHNNVGQSDSLEGSHTKGSQTILKDKGQC